MRRKSDSKIILIDFGAVKEIEVLTINQQSLTTITVTLGTPGYIPSEQINGRPKLSSDIYAVGIVGIKALTGKELKNLPRDKNTGNIIWRNEVKVSNDFGKILDKMVHEYFPYRYENAMMALDALKATVEKNEEKQTTKVKLLSSTLNKFIASIVGIIFVATVFFITSSINTKYKKTNDYYNRGIDYYSQREYEKALTLFNEAIQLNPKFVYAYYGRGDVYREQRKYEKAITEYNKVIEVNSEFADAYNKTMLYP